MAPQTLGMSAEFEGRSQSVPAYTIWVICFMTMGSASFGYAASIIATTFSQPSFVKYMGLDTATNSNSLIGAMTALYYAGGVCGSFCHGWMCNKYGRKKSIIVGMLFVLLSGALLCGSVNPAMFIVFRFFSGWGSFQCLASVPLWVSELVPPKKRGILVDIHAVSLNAAYLVAAYVGVGFYFYHGINAWRGPLGLQMIFPAIGLAGIHWMPESPRYLITKGRIEEAWAIVHRLHHDKTDPTDHFAKREFYQMRKQIELDATLPSSYLHIFKTPSLRRRAIITMWLTFNLMSCGVLVINNYGSLIYTGMGYRNLQVLHIQAGWQIAALVMNVAAMLFVDRVKRNRLMSFGFAACCVCLIIEAALQKTFLGSDNKSGLAACAAMLFVYVTFYSLALDGPTYFYIAEIWPTHLRSQGLAMGIGVLSLTNMVWLQAAPTAFSSIGWKFYIFFIVFSAIGSLVALFLFPDTLHKPLEEIAALFGDHDLVVLYQAELDHTQIPMDIIEEQIPENARSAEKGLSETKENV